jgi:hypothetical protein
MNTFLTEFEHGLTSQPYHKPRRVNFSSNNVNIRNSSIDIDRAPNPYVTFYLNNIEKIEGQLNRRMNRLMSKSFDATKSAY